MKITLRLAAAPVVLKELEPLPCCLCVLSAVDDFLVQDVPIQALPKDDVGKLIWRARESCALIIPETWVDEVEGADGERKKVVFGVDAIVKDHWHLVCCLLFLLLPVWSDTIHEEMYSLLEAPQ